MSASENYHCTSAQLQGRLDGHLEPEELRNVEDHLTHCATCSRAYAALSALDGSIRRVPLSGVSDGFTRNVMAALRLDSRPSFFYNLLLTLPYALGLVMVLGMMAVAFLLSEAVTGAPAHPAPGGAGQILSVVSEGVRVFGDGVAGWLSERLPFLFSQGAVSISLLLLLMLLFLAGVDRLVERRIFARAHQ